MENTIKKQTDTLFDWAFKSGDAALAEKLTISGFMTDDDFRYIRDNMAQTLKELDMGGASVEGNELKAGALCDCAGLVSVTIPASLTAINNLAFACCFGMQSINAPANNPCFTSEDGILFDSRKTRLICFPRGRQGDYVIPASVVAIGSRAFSGCAGLTAVIIPASVVEIGEYAFEKCSNLMSVTIPHSVVKIAYYAFRDCAGLTAINIPNSVIEIESGAFSGCKGLTEVFIPASVRKFDAMGFPVHIHFTLHPDNPSYIIEDGVLFNREMTKILFCHRNRQGGYAIPRSVVEIGEFAFYCCAGLTAITIPDTVTKIEILAFCDCNGLTSVTIPASVAEIEFRAFAYCEGLTAVFIPASLTKISEQAFEGSPARIDVHPDNPVYASEDGVLVEKSNSDLCAK